MGIDEQFEEFRRLLLCLQRDLNEARADIRSLRFGDRVSFSLQEAAEVSGIDYQTLRKRCLSGQLAYTQAEKGGSILIKRTDLEAYLDRFQVKPGSPEPEYEIKLSKSAKRAVATNTSIRFKTA